MSWRASHTAFGKCSFLVSPYAWVAFLLILWNFGCGQCNFISLVRSARDDVDLLRFWTAFTALMCFTIVAWFLAAKKDPGSVRRKGEVMPSQASRCSDSCERDIRSFEKGGPGGALGSLRSLEAESKRLSAQMARVNKESHGVIRREMKAKIEDLMDSLQALNDKMSALRPAVAKERQKQCRNSYYVKKVMTPFATGIPPPHSPNGLPVAGICLTCHHVKTIREHHCSECGICVHRFDHHCVWIDNCVGLANQSFFLLFLMSLASSLLCYASVGMVYIRKSVIPQEQHSWAERDVSRNLLTLLFKPLFYITVMNVITNVLWFCFCTFLLIRTTRSMLTDVTFYETIKRSPYIERRFGRVLNSRLWDFKGLTMADCLLNTFHFLAQDSSRDVVNYGSHNPHNALLYQEV